MLVQQLFAHPVQRLQQAPHHKGQGAAVPEAGHKEHTEHTEQRRKPADLLPDEGQLRGVGPHQRGEQIVLQPGREADVPAVPEAGEVGGKKGRFEVFGNVQPQQQGAGPGHLRITRKVKV